MTRKLLEFIGECFQIRSCRIIRLRISLDILQSAKKDASSWQRTKAVVSDVKRECRRMTDGVRKLRRKSNHPMEFDILGLGLFMVRSRHPRAGAIVMFVAPEYAG
jgi:hypothetical protein